MDELTKVSESGLRQQHQLFAQAVLRGTEPWQAARAAGYGQDGQGHDRSEIELRMVASRLLRRQDIAEFLEVARDRELEPLRATKAEVEAFLTRVMLDESVNMRERLKGVELYGRFRAFAAESKRPDANAAALSSKDIRRLTDAELKQVIIDAELDERRQMKRIDSGTVNTIQSDKDDE